LQRICLYYALPPLLAQRGKGREKKEKSGWCGSIIVGEEWLEHIFCCCCCASSIAQVVFYLWDSWGNIYLFLFIVYFVGSAEVNGNGFRI
jgi:hypothetical protein